MTPNAFRLTRRITVVAMLAWVQSFLYEWTQAIPLLPPGQAKPTNDGAAASFAMHGSVLVGLIWMTSKRRKLRDRNVEQLGVVPRLHSACLAHFGMQADQTYARLVYRIRLALVAGPDRFPYTRPATSPEKAFSGPFNTTRLVSVDDSKLAHADAAMKLQSVGSTDRFQHDITPQCAEAIRVMLQKGDSLPHWRRDQLRILGEVSRHAYTANLHHRIREKARTAGAPSHVQELTGPLRRSDGKTFPGVHFGLMCILIDALEWPDDKLPYNMAFGFPILGEIPDSQVYKQIDPLLKMKDFRQQYTDTMATNLAWLHEVNDKMTRAGQRVFRQRNTKRGKDAYKKMKRVADNTAKEIADNLMYPGMTMVDLIKAFTAEDGTFSARVMCRHGVYQGVKEVKPGVFEPKLRCIDDAARSSSNLCTMMVETITTPSFMFPAAVAQEMARQCASASPRQQIPDISIACEDQWAAYRRIPSGQQEFSIIAAYCFEKQCTMYYVVKGHCFGLQSSVVNYNRIPHFLVEVAVRLFAAAATHYVDDFCVVDLKKASSIDVHEFSAQACMVRLHGLVGCEFEEEKRRYAWDDSPDGNVFLGVTSDLSQVRTGHRIIFRPTAKRMSGILHMMRMCRDAGQMSGHAAQVLLGKLGFCLQAGRCRIGRAATLPLVERASTATDRTVSASTNPSKSIRLGWPVKVQGLPEDHPRHFLNGSIAVVARPPRGESVTVSSNMLGPGEREVLPLSCVEVHRSTEWTPRMDAMLEFFETIFDDFPDLSIPLQDGDSSFVVMYTDASNSARYSGLGAILIDDATNTRLVSQARVPPDILRSLTDEVSAPINHLEILAILCALITFRHELRGRKIYWGVDNTSALSAVIHGYTPSASMNPLVHAVQIALAHLQCDTHFEYVPSAANPADLPSREPQTWSAKDKKVMADLRLNDDSSQRTMRIPSDQQMRDPKRALHEISRLCRPDSS
jgi:hypothetical protein